MKTFVGTLRLKLTAALAALACVPTGWAVSVSPEELAQASEWVAAKFQGVVASQSPAVGLVVLANHDPVQLNARGGRPLKIVDTQYSRGLYCHAVSKVVVRLPGPAKSFNAIVGVDSNEQTSGGRGSVVFAVMVSGKEAFRSALMHEGMAGVPVSVPLDGAGQWSMQFSRDDANGVRVRGGQELTHFRLHPGEDLRGPMVVVQFYQGDWLRAQNIWRRWMLAHNLPRPYGKPVHEQLAACSSRQFGEMIHANTANQIQFIDRYREERLGLDYWWMDAEADKEYAITDLDTNTITRKKGRELMEQGFTVGIARIPGAALLASKAEK